MFVLSEFVLVENDVTVSSKYTAYFKPLMHNVPKWSDTL